MKFKSLLSALMVMCVLTATAQLDPNYKGAYYNSFKQFFTDDICSVLAEEYSAMTDEQLTATMVEQGVPEQLIKIAMKIKNNSWAPREKEFRVSEHVPHSNVYKWSNYLNTYQYTALQLPTGITATTGDTLIVFISENAPSVIQLEEVPNNDPYSDWYVEGSIKYLSRGLNIVTVSQSDAILFLGYTVTTDTTATSKKIADYPVIGVHIEGGNVNGYFDLKRHTDEDWRDMLENHFKHYSVQVKGERVLFHMVRENIAKVCPNTITDAIGWWDECVHWQHELMGVDKFHDRFNSLLMARDGYEGSYMYANMNYTYYEHETLKDILPWATVYANPGQMWGPAHEIGHINQGAINLVSCTEASNNLFSNVHLFRTGKTTTRGTGVSGCINDYNNKTAFPLRGDVIGKSRMYFQLYLYFHAAGKDTTFYPRLFEALRHDPIYKGANMSAVGDQLKFAEKCCEIAQMDLSEFFEAWGFFEPMDNVFVSDYGNYNVTMTAEEAEASREKMQQYEKKGGHLIFIEDRIKPSPRTDGVAGNRLDFSEEYAIGKMGETGQWEDYIDENVKATGYYFVVKTNKIEILKSGNAAGALGFKLYDAKSGELLSFSNVHSISIPAYAYNREYKVVAAQADGTDVELMNAAESDEEHMQKAALEALLSKVKVMLQKTTKTGNEIGRFFADAVTDLKALYNDALKAVENNDTSVHSYAEWNSMINEEVERVNNNPEARAKLKAGEVYNFINAEYRSYLADDEAGLKSISGNGSDASRRWLIDAVAYDGTFVIKNKNGEYINDVKLEGATCTGEYQETAVLFKVTYNDNSTLYITTAEEDTEEMHLTVNGDGNVIGSKEVVDGSLWNVVRVEKEETAIEEIEAEDGDNIVYDLLGRKVTEPVKGIYIKNGKATVIK